MTTEDTKPANGQPATSTALATASPARAMTPAQESFQLRLREAKALSESTLVPEAYRQNIPNVLIAMDMAQRIDASIFAVMQNLHVIHGKPTFAAQFLIATVNASSKEFTPLRYRFQGKEGTDEWGCRCVAKDVQTGEECVGPLVTIRMAKDEGWYSRSGSKWKTLPELMLSYRAAGFWTRLYAPEKGLGMQTSEEVIDAVVSPAARADLPAAARPGSAKALEAELLDDTPTATPRARDYEADLDRLKASISDRAAGAMERAVAWDGPEEMRAELQRFMGLMGTTKETGT